MCSVLNPMNLSSLTLPALPQRIYTGHGLRSSQISMNSDQITQWQRHYSSYAKNYDPMVSPVRTHVEFKNPAHTIPSLEPSLACHAPSYNVLDAFKTNEKEKAASDVDGAFDALCVSCQEYRNPSGHPQSIGNKANVYLHRLFFHKFYAESLSISCVNQVAINLINWGWLAWLSQLGMLTPALHVWAPVILGAADYMIAHTSNVYFSHHADNDTYQDEDFKDKQVDKDKDMHMLWLSGLIDVGVMGALGVCTLSCLMVGGGAWPFFLTALLVKGCQAYNRIYVERAWNKAHTMLLKDTFPENVPGLKHTSSALNHAIVGLFQVVMSVCQVFFLSSLIALPVISYATLIACGAALLFGAKMILSYMYERMPTVELQKDACQEIF